MDPTNPITYANGVQTVTGDGVYSLSCTAHDYAGNTATGANHTVQIDGMPPVVSLLCNGSACLGGWYTGHIPLSLHATDATSGVATALFSFDGGATWVASATLADGLYTVRVNASDAAGNNSAVPDTVILVDSTAPVTAWTVADNSWVGGVAQLGGTSTDITSGVAQVYLSFDDGATWLPAGNSSPWTYAWDTRSLMEGATYTIQARADDVAGNAEHTAVIHLRIDNLPPNVALPNLPMGYDPSRAIFLSSDAESGLDHAQVTFSGNGITPRVTDYPTLTGNDTIAWNGIDGSGRIVPTGTYYVLVEVWDRVGNRGSATGQWVRPAPPTETLAPNRMSAAKPQPPAAATNTPVPIKPATGTPTSAPTSTATAAPTNKPMIQLPPLPPLPPLPFGIPVGLLFLPAIGAAFWLLASGVAFTRDRRGAELRALRRSVADYLAQRKTNSKGGEDND